MTLKERGCTGRSGKQGPDQVPILSTAGVAQRRFLYTHRLTGNMLVYSVVRTVINGPYPS
jgi:hypothetical protein